MLGARNRASGTASMAVVLWGPIGAQGLRASPAHLLVSRVNPPQISSSRESPAAP